MGFEKLDPEFKAKWVAALRSGDYKQAQGRLYTGEGYCCLGVAGHVCGIPVEELHHKHFLTPKWFKDDSLKNVPELLQYDASFTNRESCVYYLGYMNDGGGHTTYNPTGKLYSFNEIADWIDENL